MAYSVIPSVHFLAHTGNDQIIILSSRFSVMQNIMFFANHP